MPYIKNMARDIICEHTKAMMRGAEYNPKDAHELYDHMVDECSFIITERLIDGKLTPLEYNELRNELADMLWKIFEPYE